MAVKEKPKKAKLIQFGDKLEWYGLHKWLEGRCKNQLEIELCLFQTRYGSQLKPGGARNEGGLPRWKHFVKIVDLIWNYEGSPTKFVWHPFAIRQIRAACKYKRLGVCGAGSTTKSDTFAVWALVNWLCNPYKNIVLVNTTTLKDAQLRIWGKITRFFNGMIVPPPAKLVSSAYAIKAVRNGEVLEEFGLRLFAGEQSKAAESSRAIRGVKHGEGGQLIVILDEMPELSNAIMATFEENLSQNPDHSIIGLGNPNIPWDTFGQFCEPKNGGWDAYQEEWNEWEGVGGYIIRLNAEESPNIIHDRVIFPFLMTTEMLMEKRERLGPNSRAYYRGVKGAFLLEGDDETIYSPAELIKAPKECVWLGIPTKVAGFDNAFTAGGDRSVLTIGRVGNCSDGKLRVRFDKHYYINEDVKNRDVDRTTQIIKELRRICELEGVHPKDLAIDATAGGGKTFCDSVWSQWSNEILRVDFGGKASDRPVSSADREKSCVRYANRVSELWGCGKEFLRCNQICNITKEMAEELTTRRYKDTKAADGGSRIRVESKKEMKQRTQKSPDIGDSAFILLDLCRERHKLSGKDTPGNKQQGQKSPLKKRFDALAKLYAA